MMILSKIPAPSEWIAPLLASSPFVAVGALAGACAFTAGLGLPLAAGAGVVAGATIWFGKRGLRSFSRRKRRQTATAEHEDSRRESAIRRLWQASADFERGAWAQQDLERLRFLCLNLKVGEPLNHRMSSRLRAAASSVLGGVLDRLQDIVIAARESGVEEDEVTALRDAGTILGSRLEDGACRAGDVPKLDGEAVAAAISVLIGQLEHLREELRPRIVADVLPILQWMVQAEHGESVEEGHLVLNLTGSSEESRVAVRPFDLVGGMSRLLDLVFRRGQLEGALEIQGQPEEAAYKIHLSWQVRDRWHLEPAALFETVRPLTYYGSRLAIEEDLETGRMHVEAWLPRIRPVPEVLDQQEAR